MEWDRTSSAPAPANSRTARREALMHKLLVASEELTADGTSFADVSVDQLVAYVGVSRTTFYVYFEDKADLLRHLMADALQDLSSAASRWWTSQLPTTREQIRESMFHTVEMYRRHESVLSAMVEATVSEGAIGEDFQALMARFSGEIERHIVEGQAIGCVRPDLPPSETAQFLTWTAERSLYQVVRFADADGRERSIDALTSILWNTLYLAADQPS